MSIKNVLRLSYITMLLVPITLALLVTMSLGTFYKTDLEHLYGIKLRMTHDVLPQFVGGINSKFVYVNHIPEKDHDFFEDTKSIAKLDKKLQMSHSGLLVRKDNSIAYSSSFLKNINVLNELPHYGDNRGERISHLWLSESLVIMKQVDFYFKDGSEGSAFIITDINPIKKAITQFLITDIISVILILILTDLILSFLVSRHIIKPLENLKDAAVKIKNGNLDFKIEKSSNDEIGEVVSAFEGMRHKLKESDMIQSQYENDRKELIANISHDLKTPVTAIKGYVEGIMDGVPNTPEKMDRYIKTIYSKASDLDKLIEELFLFSKLDLNKVPYNFEIIDIRRYLEDSYEELQFDFEKQHIILNFYVDDKIKNNKQPLMVKADREELKRVIINVMNNAAKHMDKQVSKIAIYLKESNEFAEIIIEDNGQGIAKKDLPFIFDRFYRSDPSRNTSTGGSGLGLAIAKLIIEEHGGNIWAESEEGIGTKIHFTLLKQN